MRSTTSLPLRSGSVDCARVIGANQKKSSIAAENERMPQKSAWWNNRMSNCGAPSTYGNTYTIRFAGMTLSPKKPPPLTMTARYCFRLLA